jgi:hypothetical protein
MRAPDRLSEALQRVAVATHDASVRWERLSCHIAGKARERALVGSPRARRRAVRRHERGLRNARPARDGADADQGDSRGRRGAELRHVLSRRKGARCLLRADGHQRLSRDTKSFPGPRSRPSATAGSPRQGPDTAGSRGYGQTASTTQGSCMKSSLGREPNIRRELPAAIPPAPSRLRPPLLATRR